MEKQSPNSWLLAAAALMALTTVVHLFAGGPENYTPLRASTLDPLVISTLSVVWHAISLLLAMQAVALYYLAKRRNPAFAWALLAYNLGFALLFVAYGLADFGTLWRLPQWIAFLATAVLTWAGTRRW